MKKQWRIIPTLLLSAILGAGTWLALRPVEKEPIYQGKTLRVWLKAFDDINIINDTNRDQTFEAVRQIGTNAIPTLLQMLRASDSDLKLKLLALAKKQHWLKFHYPPPAWEGQVEAGFGFMALGVEGRAAVPELIKIYENNPASPVQHAVIMALGAIGPDAKPAIPLLLAATTNAVFSLSNNAAFSLDRIRGKPDGFASAMSRVSGNLNDITKSQQNFRRSFVPIVMQQFADENKDSITKKDAPKPPDPAATNKVW